MPPRRPDMPVGDAVDREMEQLMQELSGGAAPIDGQGSRGQIEAGPDYQDGYADQRSLKPWQRGPTGASAPWQRRDYGSRDDYRDGAAPPWAAPDHGMADAYGGYGAPPGAASWQSAVPPPPGGYPGYGFGGYGYPPPPPPPPPAAPMGAPPGMGGLPPPPPPGMGMYPGYGSASPPPPPPGDNPPPVSILSLVICYQISDNFLASAQRAATPSATSCLNWICDTLTHWVRLWLSSISAAGFHKIHIAVLFSSSV